MIIMCLKISFSELTLNTFLQNRIIFEQHLPVFFL